MDSFCNFDLNWNSFLYILFYRANNIFIYYIVGVFLFLVIPKNVYNLHKYILFLLLILLIIIVGGVNNKKIKISFTGINLWLWGFLSAHGG